MAEPVGHGSDCRALDLGLFERDTGVSSANQGTRYPGTRYERCEQRPQHSGHQCTQHGRYQCTKHGRYQCTKHGGEQRTRDP
jgi:hypothetical protein